LKFVAIAIEVYDNNGQKVTRRRSGRLAATNPSGYIFRFVVVILVIRFTFGLGAEPAMCACRREVTAEFQLTPGKAYTVLISTFNPGEERDFSLRVMSTTKVDWKKLN
jgi:hypothetical protein